jgi:hypothetical protein
LQQGPRQGAHSRTYFHQKVTLARMNGTDNFRDDLTIGQEILAKAFAGNMARHLCRGIGKCNAAQPVAARLVRDFSIFRERRRHFEGSDKAARIGATGPGEVDGSSMIDGSTNDWQAQRHIDCAAKTRVFQYR